jgi:histidine triad (HIT) family protein
VDGVDDTDAPCIFCEIVAGTESADVVWADSVAVAFLDRRPLFRGHTLVVPADHVVQLSELAPDLVGPFFRRVQLLATIMPTGLDVPGTFVAMNNIVSQSVAHLHAHVVPRRRGDGLRGFFWPRQKYAEGQSAIFADRLRAALGSFDVETFLADR